MTIKNIFNKEIIKIGFLFFLGLIVIDFIASLGIYWSWSYNNLNLASFLNYDFPDKVYTHFFKTLILVIITSLVFFKMKKQWLKWGVYTIIHFLCVNIAFIVGLTQLGEPDKSFAFFTDISTLNYQIIRRLSLSILELLPFLPIDLFPVSGMFEHGIIYINNEFLFNFYMSRVFLPFIIQILILIGIVKLVSRPKKKLSTIDHELSDHFVN